MLERIRKGSLVETAIESLRNAIEKGDWSVGDRLPVEQELSDSLGVSRNTVREAVRVLVHVGMLETRQGMAPTYALPAMPEKHYGELPAPSWRISWKSESCWKPRPPNWPRPGEQTRIFGK